MKFDFLLKPPLLIGVVYSLWGVFIYIGEIRPRDLLKEILP